jgi:hypothetical protein
MSPPSAATRIATTDSKARRKLRRHEEDPSRCFQCGVRVKDGQGIQELDNGSLKRYCDRCYKKRCEDPDR